MKYFIVENHDHTYGVVITDGTMLGVMTPFTASWYAGTTAVEFARIVKERGCGFKMLEKTAHFETAKISFDDWCETNRIRAVREADEDYRVLWEKDIKEAVDEAYKEGRANGFKIDDFSDTNKVVSDELKELEIARKQEALRKLNEERAKARETADAEG